MNEETLGLGYQVEEWKRTCKKQCEENSPWLLIQIYNSAKLKLAAPAESFIAFCARPDPSCFDPIYLLRRPPSDAILSAVHAATNEHHGHDLATRNVMLPDPGGTVSDTKQNRTSATCQRIEGRARKEPAEPLENISPPPHPGAKSEQHVSRGTVVVGWFGGRWGGAGICPVTESIEAVTRLRQPHICKTKVELADP